MQRINPYVYDPSQQIRKDLGGTALNIEEGFQRVLDRKKQEYDAINKVYQDVDLLKKDLNVYNYDQITSRANELVKRTASTIKEGGKIDFMKLGEIRREISNIADAKRNSEISGQVFDSTIKMIQANAANMKDPVGTISKIMTLMKDPNTLFSPKNMQEVVMREYRNGVDYTKMIQDKLQELSKKGTPIQGTFIDGSGARVQYQGIVPFGFEFDEKTKTIVPQSRDAEGNPMNTIETIKNSIDPDLWKGYMEQVVGYGSMLNNSVDDHAEDFIRSMMGSSINYKEVASPEKVMKEGLDVEKTNEEVIKLRDYNSPEAKAERERKAQADLDAVIARTKASNASANASNASATLSTVRANDIINNPSGEKKKDEGAGVQLLGGGSQLPLSVKYKGRDYNNVVVNQKGGLSLSDGKKNVALTDTEAASIRNSMSKEDRAAFDQLTSDSRYKGKLKTTSVTPSQSVNKKPRPY